MDIYQLKRNLIYIYIEANVPSFQVPYYLAELTEKIAEDNRIKVLKVSQAKLKVNCCKL